MKSLMPKTFLVLAVSAFVSSALAGESGNVRDGLRFGSVIVREGVKDTREKEQAG
jgi:hypothetical protein